jgi:putative phage-type endonuclease
VTLTPDQLAQRARGVSASEVASIVGVSPYEGAWGCWAKKKGQLVVEMTDEMLLGHLIEPVIATMYERRHPDVTLRLSDTLTHPTESWAMATPDRIVTRVDGSEYLLECKTGGPHATKEWGDGEDEIPPQYICQTQWQMYVTGLDRCDVAGYIGGALRFHTVNRHDGIIAALVSQCRSFYEAYILGDAEPAVDFRASTTAAIAALYPEARTPLRDATSEESSALAEYLAASARVKAEEMEKDRIGNTLRAMIGDAEGIRAMGVRATWKAPTGGITKWKAVAEAMAATEATIAANTTPYDRRLDVRTTKDKR